LPFMQDIFQASYINPTVIPEHTKSIGIISLSAHVTQNGFFMNKFVTQNGNKFTIDPEAFYSQLKDKNMFYIGEDIDLFHLRFKKADNFFWLGVRQNAKITAYMPKDFFALPLEGNEPFVGSKLEFNNFRFNTTLYNEFTFGMMKELPRWVFGGRISLLQGIANIKFDPNQFNVEVFADSLRANADAKIYTAGIPKNGQGDPSFDHVGEPTYIINTLTSFKNKGFALSGGVTYKLDDRTRFSASFSDLGFISWKDSVEAYTVTGKSAFDGFKLITDYLYNRDTDVDSVLNKMEDDFGQDTIQQSYRTWLNPRFNLSASYNLARRTSLGLSFTGYYNKKFYPALTLGVQQGIGRFFNIIGTVSYNQRTFRNLGLGLMLKPGPLQIFVIADNLYPAHDPFFFTNANFRFGLNLVFGRVKPAEGLPYR